MIRNIIIFLLLIFCTVRTISFAIYTKKQKNTLGMVSVFLLVALFWCANILFLI